MGRANVPSVVDIPDVVVIPDTPPPNGACLNPATMSVDLTNPVVIGRAMNELSQLTARYQECMARYLIDVQPSSKIITASEANDIMSRINQLSAHFGIHQ